MRSHQMKSLSVVLLLAGTAAADSLPDGYSVAFHDKAIVVRKGKVEATVFPADGLDSAKLDPKTGNVTIAYETLSCTLPASQTVTFASLKARIENGPALVRHRKKDWKSALAGFQRAIAADPTWNVPAFNAASAQQLLGDKDGAVATLAPWLEAQPLHTFVQIHLDPELAPLAGRAEVQAVAAKHAGDVIVTPDGITGEVGISSELGLIAFARDEGSWGNSQFMREIEIVGLHGNGFAVLPLVEFSESATDCYAGPNCTYDPAAKKALAARAASVQAILRELGFTRAKTEAGTNRSDDGTKIKLSFPNHKLGFVMVDGQFRVLRKDTELTKEGMIGGRLSDVTYVEDANVLVVHSRNQGAEGCTSTDPTFVQISKLAP